MPGRSANFTGMAWRRRARGRGPSRRRGRSPIGTACALLLGACSGPPGTGRTLGDDLGTFSVDAAEVANECGAGAVGSAPEMRFDVDLARADAELFWDGRVGGTIDANLDFEFAARVDVALRPARGADPGCNVTRDDFISGALIADGAGAVTGFTGDMRFDFAATAESTCTPDDTTAAALARLPCRLSYRLEGARTRVPEP